MSKRNAIPNYRLHRQSGQAVVTLPDGLGSRRDVLLGTHGTSESRQEYARVIAEWEANGRRLPQSVCTSNLTVNELIVRFWSFVEAHYRHPGGTATSEQEDFKLSLRPLRHVYGHTPAKEFGPRSLKAVRQLMVEGYDHPEFGPQLCLSRGVVNQRVGRIRRMFKWAVAEELVPETVHRALLTVSGLQRGRSAARETEPIGPVADPVVDATLPFVRPQVAAMIQLQRHTGMRPGEVVLLRGMDLDTSGSVWFYRPGSDQGPYGRHKTSWRGHGKVIAIGPKAQDVLKPWLRLKLSEYLFQPREAMAAFRDMQRRNRKTKVQPSQRGRRMSRPRKLPGERYTSRSYARAVAEAVRAANRAGLCDDCKRALPKGQMKSGHGNRIEPCSACRGKQLPHWHPNQLRHTKATEIRREFGLDAARAVLGHRSPVVTEVYAELDMGRAAEVMERLG